MPIMALKQLRVATFHYAASCLIGMPWTIINYLDKMRVIICKKENQYVANC